MAFYNGRAHSGPRFGAESTEKGRSYIAIAISIDVKNAFNSVP